MSLEEFYNELVSSEELTAERILNNLLKSDENLPLKTQIEHPRELTILTVLSEILENKGLKNSAFCLQNFIYNYLQYMVSYKRKSREEIIRGIIGRKEANEEVTEKRLKKLLGI